mmetsp:Transcript_11313/g.18921  ORF Transcript_11313/g.18921 Transcript_11313/m.18921 type:complete len:917 (+) Transcript_11313:11-2761(+)|eukprot:CAMPEP_0119319278 /NCGR_PEP_ID=MMETSP1333-20130426/48943_1 /TAXON_ID=418940 /ORGANISM="Scyphosphaera apsteinii, Strain RCC1455" /LENGTH=916 /DNA_ID=CAMNT_0007325645 /DNA_START=10 /DNA_END=2760 /DNA_ORIENTATION=+
MVLVALRLNVPEFTKVGLRVDRRNQVLSVNPGSPAERSGLKVGDVVEIVDGKPLTEQFTAQMAIADRTTNTPLLQVRRDVQVDSRGSNVEAGKNDDQVLADALALLEDSHTVPPLLELRLFLPRSTKAGMRVEKNEVLAVHQDSASAAAGLCPGDLVEMVDSKLLTTTFTVQQAIAERKKNEVVLMVRRGAGPLWKELQLAEEMQGKCRTDQGSTNAPESEAPAIERAAATADVNGAMPSGVFTSVLRGDTDCCQGVGGDVPSFDGQTSQDELEIVELTLHLQSGQRVGVRADASRVLGVTPGSPAEQGGLMAGDLVESVDGKALNDSYTIQKAISARTSESVKLRVARFIVACPAPEASKAPATNMPDPITNLPDSNTTSRGEGGEVEELCIEMSRDASGELGMSMYGNGRLIAVRENGSAASAGLQVEDVIVEVNGVAVTEATPIPVLMPPSKSTFSLLVRRPCARMSQTVAREMQSRRNVGGLMAQFMSTAAAAAAREQEAEHIRELERAHAASVASASAAALKAARMAETIESFTKSPLSDVFEVFDEGSMPHTTRAVVQVGPRLVKTQTMAVSSLMGAGEALVCMSVASLAEIDLRSFIGGHATEAIAPQRVLGQTAVGKVAALAKGVRGFSLGDLVVFCQNDELLGAVGCQAGFIQVPDAETNLIKVAADPTLHPEDVLFAAEPLAAGMSIAKLAMGSVADRADTDAHHRPRRCYAVIGCNPLGLVAVAALRLLNDSEALILAVDNEPKRRELAMRFEATQALSFAQVRHAVQRIDDGRGFDGVVEALGTPSSFDVAFGLLANGGTIASLSSHLSDHLPLSARQCCNKSARLAFGSRQDALRHLFGTALKLVRAKRFPLIDLVTHRLSIDDAQQAYDVAADHSDECVMVVLYPSGQQPEGAARALFTSLD